MILKTEAQQVAEIDKTRTQQQHLEQELATARTLLALFAWNQNREWHCAEVNTDIHPIYIELVQLSLLFQGILGLTRISEIHKDSLTLASFMKRLKQQIQGPKLIQSKPQFARGENSFSALCSEELAIWNLQSESQSRLAELDDDVAEVQAFPRKFPKVWELRNKSVAHFDKSNSNDYAKLKTASSVTYEDVHKLGDRIGELLCKYSNWVSPGYSQIKLSELNNGIGAICRHYYPGWASKWKEFAVLENSQDKTEPN